jgi:hypothetical protein
MKLYAKLTSERGKEITKSGNDWLKIEVQDENRNIIFTKTLYPNKTKLKATEPEADEYSCNCNEGGKTENHIFWTMENYREQGNPICPFCDDEMYKI